MNSIKITQDNNPIVKKMSDMIFGEIGVVVDQNLPNPEYLGRIVTRTPNKYICCLNDFDIWWNDRSPLLVRILPPGSKVELTVG